LEHFGKRITEMKKRYLRAIEEEKQLALILHEECIIGDDHISLNRQMRLQTH
jgi:hypothetical protein